MKFCHQQAASSVLYTTSCKHNLVLLKMDEIIARNLLNWLKLLIKLLLLHLFGCLYYRNLKSSKTSQSHDTVSWSFAEITMKEALIIVNVFIRAVQKANTKESVGKLCVFRWGLHLSKLVIYGNTQIPNEAWNLYYSIPIRLPNVQRNSLFYLRQTWYTHCCPNRGGGKKKKKKN